MQVSWSPNHEDKFFTFGTDLCLYRVDNLQDEKILSQKEEDKVGLCMKISDRTHASLMSIATDVQFKCVAWRPNSSPDHLLAVGLSTGRVQISCFGKGGSADPLGLIGKDFVLRHPRPCSFLQWNPVDSYLLAEGVERYRQDSSLLIWDICSQPSDVSVHSDRKSSVLNTDCTNVCITKPLYEMGSSEISHSVSWFHNSPRTMIAGMNNKCLRIYDLRDAGRSQIQTATKSVNCVCVDKLFECRIASCHENYVTIWDSRNFDKPILTHQLHKNLLKIAWCPARAGLLSFIIKESPVLHLYDYQQFASGVEDFDPPVIERFVLPSGQNQISSFDWHPTQTNRLLTVSSSGAVTDVRVLERVAICWSPDIYLTWACGSQVCQFHSVKLCKDASDDISVKMRRRALKGYGLSNVVEDNIKCVAGEEKLRKLWAWISMMKSLHVKGNDSRFPCTVHPFVGVKSIVQSIGSSITEQEVWFWQGIDSQNKMRPFRKIYHNEERLIVLEMCGWSFDKDSLSLPVIDKLESECQFEQAAAIAVFNLKLTRAISTLQNGAIVRNKRSADGGGSDLNVFAMALSGFTDDRKTMWKELCSSLISTISHPYLRAVFYFLTTESDNYDGILNDSKLELPDQVAFACMYLPDAKLSEYINQLTLRYVSEGNPCGILLTGLSEEGVELFASYVDRTYDIQTPVVALVQAFSTSDLAKNSQVQLWIETYRELLDKMKLWKERAEFDVFLCKHEKTREQEVQLYICCNFCGKSISFESLANRNRVMNSNTGSGPPIKPRIASCPSCHKPLPRCALCLLHMGTPAGMSKVRPGSNRLVERKLSKISDWFTWCQSCHHGGHAEHLMTWFKDHSECPVSGCTCHCAAVDPLSDAVSSSTTAAFSVNSPEKLEEETANTTACTFLKKE